jgi:hypothetical protein
MVMLVDQVEAGPLMVLLVPVLCRKVTVAVVVEQTLVRAFLVVVVAQAVQVPVQQFRLVV